MCDIFDKQIVNNQRYLNEHHQAFSRLLRCGVTPRTAGHAVRPGKSSVETKSLSGRHPGGRAAVAALCGGEGRWLHVNRWGRVKRRNLRPERMRRATSSQVSGVMWHSAGFCYGSGGNCVHRSIRAFRLLCNYWPHWRRKPEGIQWKQDDSGKQACPRTFAGRDFWAEICTIPGNPVAIVKRLWYNT